MSDIQIDWLKEKTFVGTDSTGHGIVISTPDAPNGTGVKPSDLLLLGLAACTAVDVVEILVKKRQSLERMEIRAHGQQDEDPPWAFRKIQVHYIFYGRLEPTAVEQAIHLSESKYCSVAATVRGVADISTSYEIHPSS
jgi:putative redox protein